MSEVQDKAAAYAKKLIDKREQDRNKVGSLKTTLRKAYIRGYVEALKDNNIPIPKRKERVNDSNK